MSYISYFRKHKFHYIYGYTNCLTLFSIHLIKNNIVLKDLCPSLKVCITTSEVLLEKDRLLLLKGFGLKIINEYGVSEAGGIVAFQNQKLEWKLSRETQFIEIVNKDNVSDTNSGVGEILITDLYNQAMPIIRYKVGDLGSIDTENNSYCLKELVGRINDNIILPNGKVSPGLTFYYISKSTLEKFGILKEFIIRQIKIDTFILDIVADRDLNKKEIFNIQNDLDLYLQPNLKLIINRVPKIKRPKSGKTKHFFSELDEKNIKISIIIPVYNEELYISRTIDSLLNQTTTFSFEIIIVDGMSTDGTRKIIQNKIIQNPKISLKLFDNKKQIVSSGFNIGLTNSKGNIIIRVDGHSKLDKYYIQNCILVMRRLMQIVLEEQQNIKVIILLEVLLQ